MKPGKSNVLKLPAGINVTALNPAWVKLIMLCQRMGNGEIERIRIRDGLPVLVEKSVERIKLQ